jgi:hypothetical protein
MTLRSWPNTGCNTPARNDNNPAIKKCDCGYLLVGDVNGDYRFDMDGEARVRYDHVDMGCDEVFPIAGDFEPDEDVDSLDLNYLCERWLDTLCAEPGWCEDADINRDGIVNLLDYAYLAEHWQAGN